MTSPPAIQSLSRVLLEDHLVLTTHEPALLLRRECADAGRTSVLLRLLVFPLELGKEQCSGPAPRIKSVRLSASSDTMGAKIDVCNVHAYPPVRSHEKKRSVAAALAHVEKS